MMKKRTTTKKRQGPSAARSSCQALVRLDTARIAELHRRKLQRVRKDFDTAQAQWQQFTEVDRPAYERWIHLQCGPLIAEVNRLQQEFELRSFLLAEAQLRSVFSGQSLHETLREVQDEMKREPSSPHENSKEGPSEAGEKHDPFESWENPDEEDWAGSFSRLTGKAPEPPLLLSEKVRLRTLYRELCRRLHPDAGASMNERTKQLWHEVQQAYAERDLERMESLRALCELEEEGLRKDLPCSRLLTMIKHFQNGLRSLKRLLKNARSREPGFGFSEWSDARKALVREEIQTELRDGLRVLQSELDEVNEVLRELEHTPSARRRPRARRRPQPSFFSW